MGCCAFARIILLLEHPEGSTSRTASFFFFLIKKEPFALTEAVQFKPIVPAETFNACALIGVHLVVSFHRS